MFKISNELASKIYAYILIAVVGVLLIQYFMPVLKLSGLVEKFTQRQTKNKLKEGLTDYKGYENEKDDPLFIARKNSSNIDHLKEQISELNVLQQKVDEISVKVEENGKVIAEIAAANQKKADDIAKSTKKLDINKVK